MEIVRTGSRGRRTRGGGWSVAGQAAGNVGSRRRRRDRESLWESKPEMEGERGSRNPAVDGRRVNGGTESQTGNARRGLEASLVMEPEMGAPLWSRKPRATRSSSRKKAERMEVQQLLASRAVLCELPGTRPKAAIDSAELKSSECSVSKSERKSKQQALTSEAA